MVEAPHYAVFAVRYAVNPSQRSTHNFIGGDSHDHPMPLDYYVWAIQGGGRTIIVDTGFDAATAKKRNRVYVDCPSNTLARLGIDTSSVRDVIITHLHYDHAGNYDLFPAARFHVQDREMAYATGRCMTHKDLSRPYEVDDVIAMLRKVYLGRVRFINGVHVLAPGLTLHHVGGHTDGMQVVRIWTRRGWIVLASDASHFYANMQQGRSFPLVYNVGDMLEGHRTLCRLADGPDNVIPGHDPLVMKRYPSAGPGLEGLAVRLDADPLVALTGECSDVP